LTQTGQYKTETISPPWYIFVFFAIATKMRDRVSRTDLHHCTIFELNCPAVSKEMCTEQTVKLQT